MTTMLEWMESLDIQVLERERFAVWDRQPSKREAEKKLQVTLESITKGINLNQAQQRAVTNWWKGQNEH